MRGDRSVPQSKNGLTTTDFGTYGAESVSSAAVADRRTGSRTPLRPTSTAPVEGLGVGVDEQLGRVAPQAARRVVGPVHAEAVALPGLDGRQVAVVDEPVDLGERDPGSPCRGWRTGTARRARRPRRRARSWCPRRRRWRRADRRGPATAAWQIPRFVAVQAVYCTAREATGAADMGRAVRKLRSAPMLSPQLRSAEPPETRRSRPVPSASA